MSFFLCRWSTPQQYSSTELSLQLIHDQRRHSSFIMEVYTKFLIHYKMINIQELYRSFYISLVGNKSCRRWFPMSISNLFAQQHSLIKSSYKNSDSRETKFYNTIQLNIFVTICLKISGYFSRLSQKTLDLKM